MKNKYHALLHLFIYVSKDMFIWAFGYGTGFACYKDVCSHIVYC